MLNNFKTWKDLHLHQYLNIINIRSSKLFFSIKMKNQTNQKMKNRKKLKKIKKILKIQKINLIKFLNILQIKILKIKLKNHIKKSSNMYTFMGTIMFLKINVRNHHKIKKTILYQIKIMWISLLDIMAIIMFFKTNNDI